MIHDPQYTLQKGSCGGHFIWKETCGKFVLEGLIPTEKDCEVSKIRVNNKVFGQLIVSEFDFVYEEG